MRSSVMENPSFWQRLVGCGADALKRYFVPAPATLAKTSDNVLSGAAFPRAAGAGSPKTGNDSYEYSFAPQNCRSSDLSWQAGQRADSFHFHQVGTPSRPENRKRRIHIYLPC